MSTTGHLLARSTTRTPTMRLAWFEGVLHQCFERHSVVDVYMDEHHTEYSHTEYPRTLEWQPVPTLEHLPER